VNVLESIAIDYSKIIFSRSIFNFLLRMKYSNNIKMVGPQQNKFVTQRKLAIVVGARTGLKRFKK